VALGLAALGFLLGAIVFCHLAAWFRLSLSWGEPVPAVILAGMDVVVAGSLALVAAHSSTGRLEPRRLRYEGVPWMRPPGALPYPL
jgi:hypothetical protein